MISAIPASWAALVPSPHMMIMKPSWLTVPYASSSLMSSWRSARQPPRIIVAEPSSMITGRQPGRSANAGDSSATR